MSDIKIVDWPKRPAEQRRDELERENAELRKLVEQLREAIMTECEHVCEGRLQTAECDDDCKTGCHLYAVITAAERGGE